MKVILLAALFSLTIHHMMSPTSASCGKPSLQSRVFGKDKDDKIKENPWVGTLTRTVDGKQQSPCGIILIDINGLFTSMSCVFPLRGNYKIKLGNGKETFDVDVSKENIIIPTKHELTDIALVVLSTPVPPTNFKPVCLPAPGFMPEIGSDLTFVGWRSSAKGQKLKFVQLRSLTNAGARDKLTKMMKNQDILDEMMKHPVVQFPGQLPKEDFKKRVLDYVKNELTSDKFIITYGDFSIEDHGGGLFYQKDIQGKKSEVLAGIISFFLGPIRLGGKSLAISRRVASFCYVNPTFCYGKGPTLA